MWMHRILWWPYLAVLSVWISGAASVGAQPGMESEYVPGPGDDWQRRAPQEVGLLPNAVRRAVDYALSHETSAPRDLESWLEERLEGKPANEILGPMKPRGGPSGMILRHGYLVAEWGDTERVDMAFSITKSFLATVAGVARGRDLLEYLDQPVRLAIGPVAGLGDPHNAPITWRQLLRQTSEWQGTLWGKPDTADRRRGMDRAIQAPGTFWEYNDVRVNVASLALLHLLREPLPTVLSEAVMEPIGASSDWQWHGYRNSQVKIGYRSVTSVSGGGHWGGGLWISSRDLARVGLLYSRRGRWGEARILPLGWTESVTTTTQLAPNYGLFWWVNTDRRLWPSAPASSYAARGGGDHLLWIDPEHDLVAVVRWIERGTQDGFLAHLLSALEAPAEKESVTLYRDVSQGLPESVSGMTMDARPADVNGDGHPDLVLAMEHAPNVLLLADGEGGFADVSESHLPRVPRDSEDIAAGDLDGDGDIDLVIVSEDDKVDEVLLNEGAGRFTLGPALPVADSTNAIATADLDGDGHLDLLLGNKGQNRYLRGAGDGTFKDVTASHLPRLEDTTQDLELGDVNGDGHLDLVVGNEDRNRLLLGDGDGHFEDVSEARLPLRRAAEETREVSLGDVDGDGDLDIFFANIRGFVRDADPRNRLLLNDGSGHFQDVTESHLAADSDRSFDGDFVDVDGDGDLDLLTANANVVMRDGRRQVLDVRYGVYVNDGTGRFDHDPSLLPASAVGKGFDVEVGDFDGDGRQDLYLAGRGSQDRLLLGRRRP